MLDCIYQQQDLPLLPHEQQQQQQQQPSPLQHQPQQHHQPQQQQQQQQQEAADVDMGGSSSNGVGHHSSSSSSGGGTYYIQDVLVWRGYSLVDCGADFRLFWLQSKLAEEDVGAWSLDGGDAKPGHAFR